jgi:hypothetical protein
MLKLRGCFKIAYLLQKTEVFVAILQQPLIDGKIYKSTNGIGNHFRNIPLIYIFNCNIKLLFFIALFLNE